MSSWTYSLFLLLFFIYNFFHTWVLPFGVLNRVRGAAPISHKYGLSVSGCLFRIL